MFYEDMNEMYDKAKQEGLFFHTSTYHDLWFCPDELKQLQEEGKFRWGKVNWELVDPNIYIERQRNEIKKLEKKI